METAVRYRGMFRTANASVILGLLSGILFLIFYTTDLKLCLLVTHLLGAGAFALGAAALLQVQGSGVKERGRAVAGMVLGIGHAAALGFLFSLAAAG